MTSPPPHDRRAPVRLDPDQLRAAVDSSVARNEALLQLQGSTEDLAGEVGGLRQALRRRPTRRESEHRRRVVLALALGFAALIIGGHDEHVERCGPGARVEPLVAAVAEGRQREPGLLRRLADRPAPAGCDLTFPWHTHTPGDDWPTRGNLLGAAGWALGLTAAAVYAAGPRRRPTNDDGTSP